MTPTETWKFRCKWEKARKFKRGQVLYMMTSYTDKKSGRPHSVNETVVKTASSVVSTDRPRSLVGIIKSVGISHRTAFIIVSQDLHMSKVSARWVPRLLTKTKWKEFSNVTSCTSDVLWFVIVMSSR